MSDNSDTRRREVEKMAIAMGMNENIISTMSYDHLLGAVQEQRMIHKRKTSSYRKTPPSKLSKQVSAVDATIRSNSATTMTTGPLQPSNTIINNNNNNNNSAQLKQIIAPPTKPPINQPFVQTNSVHNDQMPSYESYLAYISSLQQQQQQQSIPMQVQIQAPIQAPVQAPVQAPAVVYTNKSQSVSSSIYASTDFHVPPVRNPFESYDSVREKGVHTESINELLHNNAHVIDLFDKQKQIQPIAIQHWMTNQCSALINNPNIFTTKERSLYEQKPLESKQVIEELIKLQNQVIEELTQLYSTREDAITRLMDYKVLSIQVQEEMYVEQTSLYDFLHNEMRKLECMSQLFAQQLQLNFKQEA